MNTRSRFSEIARILEKTSFLLHSCQEKSLKNEEKQNKNKQKHPQTPKNKTMTQTPDEILFVFKL